MATHPSAALEVRRVGIRYPTEQGVRTALDGVTFRIAKGEAVALIGPSGSGKSSLLRAIAGLHVASEGEILLLGQRLQAQGRLAPNIRASRAHLGMIFQQFNLIGRLSVLTNVLAGALHESPWWRTLSFQFSRDQRAAALYALERVGLADRAQQRADTLSGGQQQRVAIARTLLQNSQVILGDEPVASLDPLSAVQVLDTLLALNRERGTTCLVSLHQVELARRYFPRVVALAAGRVVYDGPSTTLTPQFAHGLYQNVATEAPLTPCA